MDKSDSRVFDWLGVDSKGVGYYLHPLNLEWSDEGAAHDLQVFRSVAERLRGQPDHWSAIIRTTSWRHTLVGCVCVILLRPDDRFEDLSYRFERGSFVSPQVCMTMGIVYPETAMERLAAFVHNGNGGRDVSKEMAAADCVLEKLGVARSHPINRDELAAAGNHDALVAYQVVERQWDFWCEHSGKVL